MQAGIFMPAETHAWRYQIKHPSLGAMQSCIPAPIDEQGKSVQLRHRNKSISCRHPSQKFLLVAANDVCISGSINGSLPFGFCGQCHGNSDSPRDERETDGRPKDKGEEGDILSATEVCSLLLSPKLFQDESVIKSDSTVS